MKKIINLLLSVCLLFPVANANAISKYIKDSNFENNSTVSVYIKNKKNNHTVYKKNENKLLNPASTLKLLTFGASYKVLKENYKFETILYRDENKNLYLKLGADPLLKSSDLTTLFAEAKNKIDWKTINNIYIDSTIIDKTPYPDTWMQEDIWPYQRAITPFIIDNNYTEITLKRSSLSNNIDIIQDDGYKIPIINELKSGQIQDYKITKEYGENSPIITFRGTIKEDEIKRLPVANPEINFVVKLNKALQKNNYLYDRKIQFKKTPQKVTRIASVSHNIEDVSKNILYNSDNFTSEIVSKVAAARYFGKNQPATNEDAINMFYNIYKEIITPEIKIKDSSGVSRGNLVNTDFLIQAFEYIDNETNMEKLMMPPNNGTLSNRLLFLQDNLKAKTGTLSNMSAICGILKSKKQNDLVFGIIVQNSPQRSAILKNFEDNIISLIYRKY